MTTIESIYERVRNLKSSSIYELYEMLEIEIYYTPLLITHNRDSMILCTGTRKGVYIKPNSDQKYIEYLLWHELAHYILHYKPDLKMNYKLSSFREDTERQANLFAVFGMMQHIDLRDRDPIEVAVEIGIPRVVAADVIRTLAENKYALK